MVYINHLKEYKKVELITKKKHKVKTALIMDLFYVYIHCERLVCYCFVCLVSHGYVNGLLQDLLFPMDLCFKLPEKVSLEERSNV